MLFGCEFPKNGRQDTGDANIKFAKAFTVSLKRPYKAYPKLSPYPNGLTEISIDKESHTGK